MSLEQSLAIVTKELQNAFKTFDSDGSGTIQPHQLGQLLRRLTDVFNVQQPNQEDINQILKQLDVNGDGKISQKQFEALVVEVVKIIQQQKIKTKKQK